MSEARFYLDSNAASPLNLAFSEIMYHPADPTAAEIAAGFADPEEFEFLEITNTGDTHADLRGLYIYDAVRFDFDNSLLGPTLAPGARLLLVANPAAFEFRYGSGPPIAGGYSGNLANSGETITLQAADDSIIRQVTYSDTGDWPAAADGPGHSLVAITPADFSTDNDAAHWRASATTGGNPGGSDAVLFPAWLASHSQTDPHADPDADGLDNLMEYAIGGSPVTDDRALSLALTLQESGVPAMAYPVLTHRLRLAADDAIVTLEVASDPTSPWAPAGLQPIPALHSDGTATLVHLPSEPAGSAGRNFWRLRVQLR
jgi:hypothetical protein